MRPILKSPIDQIAKEAVTVVGIEGPVHIEELLNRIVSIWNTKAGKKIVGRITEGINWAVQMQWVMKKGDFFFPISATVSVRSRSGLNFEPERIAPEEYREAVLLILRTGYVFPRKKLADEVRTLLGFGRTTATLEVLIGHAIDDLLSSGIAGDASYGISLRNKTLNLLPIF